MCSSDLNPAPWQELPPSLLANTDWLVVNEVEHSELKPGSYSGNLVVTLGSKGAELILVDGKRKFFKAPKVKAVDTTGAGDCLIGTFAAGLARGDSPSDALKLGVKRASESVTKIGAQNGELRPNAKTRRAIRAAQRGRLNTSKSSRKFVEDLLNSRKS